MGWSQSHIIFSTFLPGIVKFTEDRLLRQKQWLNISKSVWNLARFNWNISFIAIAPVQFNLATGNEFSMIFRDFRPKIEIEYL